MTESHDPTTLYYFFSTVAQTHAAIVGLVGMFMAYRIEQLERYGSKEKIRNVKGGTKGRFILFLLTNLVVIFFSFIFLLSSKDLAGSQWGKIGSVSLVCACVLIALCTTVYLSFLLLETKWEEFWQWFKANVREHSQKWGKGKTIGGVFILVGGYSIVVSLVVTYILKDNGEIIMVIGMGLFGIGVLLFALGKEGK